MTSFNEGRRVPQDSPNAAAGHTVWQKRRKRDKLVPHEAGKNSPVQEEYDRQEQDRIGTWTQHGKPKEKDFVISFRETRTWRVTLNPEPNKTSTLTCFQQTPMTHPPYPVVVCWIVGGWWAAEKPHKVPSKRWEKCKNAYSQQNKCRFAKPPRSLDATVAPQCLSNAPK